MFYKLTYILISFFCFSLSAQKKKSIYSDILEYSLKFESEPYLKKSSVFFADKKWDSILIYTQKQLKKNNNIDIKNLCYYLRGVSFSKKKMFTESENHLKLISNDFKFHNITEFYLAYVNMSLYEYNKAITHLLPLSKLPNEKIIYFNKNKILNNLALCFYLLEKFDKSEFYFKQFNQNTKDTLKLIMNYSNRANLYYKTPKNHEIAIKYFKKAYNISKYLNDFNLKRKAAKNMAVIEENRKNFEKALIYRKESQQWKDSLNDQNKIYEVAKLEKEFAVKEKQKEVDILQVKNELQATQRNIFLYAAIGLLILLSISFYFYREKVKRNKIIAHQKENLDVLNATKDKLFSIVSHDLRSSVNALKSSNIVLLDNLASKNIVALGNLLKKNSAIVNGAYGLLDNLLHWALSQTKQGYFEITGTRLFFMVEQMAYNYKPLMLEKNIQFENKVLKKAIAFADQESLKLIIRNLLDNAIKFSTKDGIIKVYSRNKQEGYCDLIVKDTGMGMSNDTRLKLLEDTLLLSKKEHETVIGTGLGLQLCKTMIKKNNGKFSIESELGIGTKMIVSLPKKQDNG